MTVAWSLLAILGPVVVVLFAMVVHRRRPDPVDRRREQLSAFAAEHGFRFVPRDDTLTPRLRRAPLDQVELREVGPVLVDHTAKPAVTLAQAVRARELADPPARRR